jgi:hypothetical protein
MNTQNNYGKMPALPQARDLKAFNYFAIIILAVKP